MNEKIKELADQATEVSEPLSGNLCPDTPDLAKFAELLVRECLDIIKHNICEPEYRGGSQILESYENYQANRRLEDILNQIQKHFGVEE